MKISDLKMYGVNPKTFVTTIEEYDVHNTDEELKDKIIVLFYAIIGALGYDRNKIDTINDIQIFDITRIDEDNLILCTINIYNL